MIFAPKEQLDILRNWRKKSDVVGVLPPFQVTSEKVKSFMTSDRKISVLAGGNRSGKTYSSVRKAVEFGVNRPGSLIWMLTINYKMVGSVLAPVIFQHLPPEFIAEIAWSNYRLRIPDLIRMRNGTEIFFKTYDSKFESLQGASVDLIVMDEEPVDKNIFIECLARTLDRRGKMSMSFTPLHGKSCWTYKDLYLASQKPNADIDFFTISLFDNPYIPQSEKDLIVNLYGEDEVERRVYGLFTTLSGACFKELNAETHYIDSFPIPTAWRKFRAIDLGYKNPFVCLWAALSEDNVLYFYEEYYQAETLLSVHADAIRQIDRTAEHHESTDIHIENTVCDHARQERAELEQHGIFTDPAQKDVDLSIAIMNRLLKSQQLFVFRDRCPKLCEELENYRYADTRGGDKEQPLKVNDHSVDAARYAVMYAFGDTWEFVTPEHGERSAVLKQ